VILLLLTGLVLAGEPPPGEAPPGELPPGAAAPLPHPMLPPLEPEYVPEAGELRMEAHEWARWKRGRRVGLTGLFLGWAGVGLAAGGTTLAISGRAEGPLTDRQVLVVTGVTGAGLASLGVGLQITGSRMQQSAVFDPARRARGLRAVAAGLGVVGIGASAVTAWSLLDDDASGPTLLIAAPLAVVGVLGATGLHTIALIDADTQLEEAQLEVLVTPTGVGIRGRF